MKAIEKYIGLTSSDVQTLLPNLKQAGARIYKDYTANTHPKLKMLDSLIVLSIATFFVQLVYANALVLSRDPFNSYLAGIFCSIGQFALAGKPFPLLSLAIACLRVQLSDLTFEDYSNKKAVAEFIVGSFLLYLSCLCLIG